MDFSRERILENFLHDNTTGKIYRKRNNAVVSTKDPDGYVVVAHCVNGKSNAMRGARLVWVMYNGEIPDGMVVDHINRVRDDNRVENLRLATPKQNSANKHNEAEEYSSKYRGVKKDHHGRWVAQISGDKIDIILGKFDNEDAAAACYNHAAKEKYGEYAFLNPVPEIDFTQFLTKRNRKTLIEEKRGLPEGLRVLNTRYYVEIDKKRLGLFKKEHLSDAILFCNTYHETGREIDLKTNLVHYNEHGLPYYIFPCSTGYRASFMKDRKKRIHVGTFKTVLEAQEALYLEMLEVFGYVKRYKYD